MTNKITTVFIADTTLEVTNKVQPVTTSFTSSKLFRSTKEIVSHKMELYDAIHGFETDNKHNSSYADKLESALEHNNGTRQLLVDREISQPHVTWKEVKIADLTAEQKIEFEKLYDMKIIEETFANKTVSFKTPSKVYAVSNNERKSMRDTYNEVNTVQ